MLKCIAGLQVVSGIVGMLVIILCFPVYAPKIQSVVNSTAAVLAAGEGVLSMSVNVLEDMQGVLGELDRSFASYEQTIPKLEQSTKSVASNMKYWGSLATNFRPVFNQLSDTTSKAAQALPVKIPTGFLVKTHTVDLKVAKVAVPQSIEPAYTELFVEQRKSLESTANTFSEMAERFGDTTKILATAANGLDEEMAVSLQEASQSLKIARAQMNKLTDITIPAFLSEMKQGISDLQCTRKTMGRMNDGLAPAAFFLVFVSLLWTMNGVALILIAKSLDQSKLKNLAA